MNSRDERIAIGKPPRNTYIVQIQDANGRALGRNYEYVAKKKQVPLQSQPRRTRLRILEREPHHGQAI